MVETRSSRTPRVDNSPGLKFGAPIVLKRRKLANEAPRVDDIPILKDSTPIVLKRKKLATDETPTTSKKKNKLQKEQVEKQNQDISGNAEQETEQVEKQNEDMSGNAEKKTATAEVFEAMDDVEDVISNFLEQVEALDEEVDKRGEDALAISNIQELEARDSDVEATEDPDFVYNEQELESEDIESDAEDIESDAEGTNKQKKKVHFNDKGQPIGEGAASFTSHLGSMARKYCPISHEQWRDVPDQAKDKIWKLVNDNYIVPVLYKGTIFHKIQTSWRNFKCTLRSKIYDKYDTDKERKRNRPTGIRQADWDIFVDNQSKPTMQARRKQGKLARQAMKTPHTSGRRGAARTAEDLKKGNPSATVTRTELYLAVHCRKDGSCPTPELKKKVDQIKAIAEQDPSSINLDVNHDPVRQVCGPDKWGVVRGMGVGINKTTLLRTAPIIDELEQERKLRLSAEKQIADLRKQLNQLQKDRGPLNSDDNPIADLRKQVDQLQQDRTLWSTAEQQVAHLKEQVVDQREQLTAQGLMLADTRELMIRLCS